MIPFSYVSGTFYTATGATRANETITFMPLSTPYAIEGELVLSLPQLVTLDNQGRLTDGVNLYYKLAKGYYRVIASDTDAFFISVSDDQQVHNIDSLASEVGGAPTDLKRILVSRDIWDASDNTDSITRSLSGYDVGAIPTRLMFLGESGDLSADTVFPMYALRLGVNEMVVLGNANPGGSAGTIEARLFPWDSWQGENSNQHFWYPAGSEDWLPGNLSAVTNFLTTPGLRYYKKVFSSMSLAMFVIDSNALEPDGNTSGSVQGAWLQSELAASSERWKIVVFRDSPFVSVTGKSLAAMDWPFAQWGAHAVIAAGAKVMEQLSLSGGIPLFVTGCAGTGTKDTFGTPLGTSVYRLTNVRAGLSLSVYTSRLIFHILSLTSGEVYREVVIEGAEDQKLTWSVNVQWDSGLSVNTGGVGLTLEPYGMALISVIASDPIARIMDPLRGGIMRMSYVPTAADAAQVPWLKSSLVAVGDDPVVFYWWNTAKGDFVRARFDTFDGYSYYTGTRTQLAMPSLTPGPGGQVTAGTVIDHTDQTVEIWVSENGDTFSSLSTWPTDKRYMFQQPRNGHPVFFAAFARKPGYIDSDIVSGSFLIGG